MQVGVDLLILDMLPIYMIIALDIVIIICSSINCPTVICLPIVWYFLEKSHKWNLRLPGLFSIILLSDLLFQKPKNILLHFFFLYFILCFGKIYLSNLIQFNPSQYHGGIDNPSYALSCKYLLFVCRIRLHSVAWSPTGLIPWFHNWGKYCCDASSFPLQGKYQRRYKQSASSMWVCQTNLLS